MVQQYLRNCFFFFLEIHEIVCIYLFVYLFMENKDSENIWILVKKNIYNNNNFLESKKQNMCKIYVKGPQEELEFFTSHTYLNV